MTLLKIAPRKKETKVEINKEIKIKKAFHNFYLKRDM